jgi:hypothetical protein
MPNYLKSITYIVFFALFSVSVSAMKRYHSEDGYEETSSKRARINTVTIYDLPVDILFIILNDWQVSDLLLKVALVDKSFKKLASSIPQSITSVTALQDKEIDYQRNYFEVVFNRLESFRIENISDLKAIFLKYPATEDLSLFGLKANQMQEIIAILNKKVINKLTLKTYTHGDINDYFHINISEFENLKQLEIVGEYKPIFADSIDLITNLQEITVRKADLITDNKVLNWVNIIALNLDGAQITDQGLQTIAKNNPKLRRLYLNNTRDITPKGLANIVLLELEELSVLNIDLMDLTAETLKSERFPKLKTFQASGNKVQSNVAENLKKAGLEVNLPSSVRRLLFD